MNFDFILKIKLTRAIEGVWTRSHGAPSWRIGACRYVKERDKRQTQIGARSNQDRIPRKRTGILIGKGDFPYRWIIVLTCSFSLFIASSISQTFTVYFLPISTEFGWDRAQVSLALSANMLVTAFFLPVAGKLTTIFGPRKVILGGVLMMGPGTIFLGMISSLWQYYLLIGLSGIGFCLAGMIPGTALIARWFQRNRATAMSIFLSGYPISQIALVPMSTYFSSIYGWRYSFILYGSFFIVIIPLIFILLKDNPPTSDLKLGKGANSKEINDGHIASETDVSIAQALKSRSFPLLIGVHVLCGITDIALTTHFMPFLLDSGFSEIFAASILSLVGFFVLVGTVVVGPLSDRFGRKNLATGIYAIRAFSILLILGTPDPTRFYAFAVLFGFSYFSMVSLFGAWMADNYGTLSLGKLNGVISSAHSLAASIGIYFLGMVFDIYKNYYWGLFILLILAGLAALSTFLLKERNALGLENLRSRSTYTSS